MCVALVASASFGHELAGEQVRRRIVEHASEMASVDRRCQVRPHFVDGERGSGEPS